MGGPERRKDPRANVWLPVRYRLLPESRVLWDNGTVTDFSAGGLRLLCDRRIEPESQVEFELNPTKRERAYVLRGTVMWVKPSAAGCECGVMFIDVSPDQQFELDEIVQFLLRKQAQP